MDSATSFGVPPAGSVGLYATVDDRRDCQSTPGAVTPHLARARAGVHHCLLPGADGGLLEGGISDLSRATRFSARGIVLTYDSTSISGLASGSGRGAGALRTPYRGCARAGTAKLSATARRSDNRGDHQRRLLGKPPARGKLLSQDFVRLPSARASRAAADVRAAAPVHTRYPCAARARR